MCLTRQEFIDQFVAMVNKGIESGIVVKSKISNKSSYKCQSCINCTEHDIAWYFTLKEEE